jgi:hypothetical protein
MAIALASFKSIEFSQVRRGVHVFEAERVRVYFSPFPVSKGPNPDFSVKAENLSLVGLFELACDCREASLIVHREQRLIIVV